MTTPNKNQVTPILEQMDFLRQSMKKGNTKPAKPPSPPAVERPVQPEPQSFSLSVPESPMSNHEDTRGHSSDGERPRGPTLLPDSCETRIRPHTKEWYAAEADKKLGLMNATLEKLTENMVHLTSSMRKMMPI